METNQQGGHLSESERKSFDVLLALKLLEKKGDSKSVEEEIELRPHTNHTKRSMTLLFHVSILWESGTYPVQASPNQSTTTKTFMFRRWNSILTILMAVFLNRYYISISEKSDF